MPGRGVLVAQRAIDVPEPLMDERDPAEVADLVRPFERPLVVGGRRGGLAEILGASPERDEDPQREQPIRRFRLFKPAEERLEQLARVTGIPGDPRRDGELVLGGAPQRVVTELHRQALRDGQGSRRVRPAVQQVEGRAGGESQARAVANGQAVGIEEPLGAAERLRGAGEREQAADRAHLELTLASGALGIRVVEEIRSRLAELPRHVLERRHRGPDLPKLDRAHVRAREVRRAELRLRDPRRRAGLAQALAELLERPRHRSRAAPARANGLRHGATLPATRAGVNRQSTGAATPGE